MTDLLLEMGKQGVADATDCNVEKRDAESFNSLFTAFSIYFFSFQALKHHLVSSFPFFFGFIFSLSQVCKTVLMHLIPFESP